MVYTGGKPATDWDTYWTLGGCRCSFCCKLFHMGAEEKDHVIRFLLTQEHMSFAAYDNFKFSVSEPGDQYIEYVFAHG